MIKSGVRTYNVTKEGIREAFSKEEGKRIRKILVKMNKSKKEVMFKRELEEILFEVREAIETILLSTDRTSKHSPYTWKDETEDEHLNKAARHILTHQLIRDGHQKEDGEEHLNNAITRLAMAIAKRKVKK